MALACLGTIVRSCAGPAVAASLMTSAAAAQTHEPIARGVVVDPVACADDPAQTYALYVPTRYSPDRAWSVLFACSKP